MGHYFEHDGLNVLHCWVSNKTILLPQKQTHSQGAYLIFSGSSV